MKTSKNQSRVNWKCIPVSYEDAINVIDERLVNFDPDTTFVGDISLRDLVMTLIALYWFERIVNGSLEAIIDRLTKEIDKVLTQATLRTQRSVNIERLLRAKTPQAGRGMAMKFKRNRQLKDKPFIEERTHR